MIDVNSKFQWNGEDVKLKGRKVVDKSIYEIGLIVEGQAKVLSPVDTGRLAGSITTQSSSSGTNPESPATSSDVIKKPSSGDEVYVGTAVDYAPYIEYGTIRSNAQSFLRPALDLAQGKTLRIVEENGKKYFADYLRK